MKRFLFLSALVVALLASLLILGADQSQTANDPVMGSVTSPIRVVGVKFGEKANWLDGLEVQIENTSDKAIQYLVMDVEIPVGSSATDRVKVPISFGRALTTGSRPELFQPKTKLNLRVAKGACERVRAQLAARKVAPALNEVQTNLHVALFENRTSWLAGRLHFPDPANSKRWIAAEEVVRSESQVNGLFGMSFAKASFKPASKSTTCYRYVGYTWDFCCYEVPSSGSPYEIYRASANFAEDPTGNVHPNLVQGCCNPSGCCEYYEIGLGCAP